MRLVIDTNIFLDVMLCRRPFFDDSQKVLRLCEQKKIQGFVTASCVTDIFYLVRKAYKYNGFAYEALDSVLEIANILPVTGRDVLDAYIRQADDFEDCLLAECAKNNRCDAIATRNKKDFESFGIQVFAPEELLDQFA